MANEIYDSTWWGNTIETASSIGTSTEMIQGQFNLTKLGDELVTNGDFATDSDWTYGSGWAINGGKLIATNASNQFVTQSLTFISGKKYKASFTVTGTSSLPNSTSLRMPYDGAISNIAYVNKDSDGVYTHEFISTGSNTIYLGYGSFTGTIDNVSVKEVRATTVEASKCLADTIHRIGLQDIQN